MNAPQRIDYQIIETASEMTDLTGTLRSSELIAVDLEADSMYHFQEKVCLLQLATKEINVIVDPLKIPDVTGLRPVFADRHIQKVFHGADYDVRSLFRDFRIAIRNLFDTELACRFLGYAETGLEPVLRNQFSVSLDKKYQRKDWSKRPLPMEMFEYAIQDVCYLIPLAEKLKFELRKKGRLSWVNEESKHLSTVRPAAANQTPLFLNFKGAGKLDASSLAVLEALLQYRKKIARKADKPLFKIISNKALMKLAVAKPASLLQLEATGTLNPGQIAMLGTDIIATIRHARQVPPEKLPVYPRKQPPIIPPLVAERIKVLRRWREKKANELNVDSALICNKALMNAIALHKPGNVRALSALEDIKHWQVKEFGQDIVKLLSRHK